MSLKDRILIPYSDQDYITRRKAQFVYRINIGLFVLMVGICAITAMLDTINPELGSPVLIQQIINVSVMLVYVISLYILKKGYLRLASHVVISLTLACLWWTIFADKLGGIYQLDTIVFIIAMLTMLPLIIGRYKKIIFLYIIANIITLTVFVLIVKEDKLVNEPALLDFFADTFMALILTGTILYFVFSIFYDALQRAKDEIKERIKVENEIKEHKKNLEFLINEKTYDLQILNRELKLTNKKLSEKNNIINNNNIELNEALVGLKKTQLKLVQNEKMLALGTLTSGVSHELNNPLNYIMGGLYGLEDYFREYDSSDDNTTKELLGSIKLGVERASDIIRGLNQFSSDSAEFTEDCDIHMILDNCLLMLQSRLKGKAKVSKKYLTKSLHIEGNVGKLHQLIINILKNAVESIQDYGRIEITTEEKDKFLTISVSDTGCGIDEKYISRVFDPFFTTKDPDKGIGLGLSIAYSIIKEHNGDIEIKTEKNKGTIVLLKLRKHGKK